jgi:hypothetical protein
MKLFGIAQAELKPLWDGRFTFGILLRISDMEKVFAKKLGFCRIKRTKLLILDQVDLRIKQVSRKLCHQYEHILVYVDFDFCGSKAITIFCT